MSNRERKELTERIKGMSQEELLIVSETIPVDLCLARIQKELDKIKATRAAAIEALLREKELNG